MGIRRMWGPGPRAFAKGSGLARDVEMPRDDY
jgi:hypothetical protein